MKLFLLAVLFPQLYWDKPPQTAPQVKSLAIARLYVPAEHVAAWKKEGVDAAALGAAVKLPPAGVQYRMNVASATNVPWIDGNGWRILRDPSRKYYYDTGPVALEMAEAYTYGADAVVHAAELDEFGRMLAFLRRIDGVAMPALANIGAIDDGSAAAGEALNLLVRRNLLFRIVRVPDPHLDLNVHLKDARNPSEFALDVRRKLGDEKRLLRLYGSEVVIGRLTGEGDAVRLHLLNYSNRKVAGLRVRVRGEYAKGTAAVFGSGETLTDYLRADGATEFTIPEMGPYAVVDLRKR